MTRKILFLPFSTRTGASTRYRIWSFLPALQKAGLEPILLEPLNIGNKKGIGPLFNKSSEEKQILACAKKVDLIFIQKRLFRTRLVDQLKAIGKPILFDWDDAIYTSPRQDWSFLTKCKIQRRLHAILSSADNIICGSRHLLDYTRQKPYQHADYLPTAVDTETYPIKGDVSPDTVTIGWIGSAVNLPYLETLCPVLTKLASQYPNLRLLIISNGHFSCPGLEAINRAWDESREKADLLEMDIGLMPLPDDEWSRGKCALKAIQYMASGLPVVLSPVGANKEVINHNEHGYFANTEAEWHQFLELLIKNPDLRHTQGLAGRKRVEEKYSLHVNAEKLIGIIHKVIDDRQGQTVP